MMESIEHLPPVVECLSLTKTFQDFWGRPRVLAVDGLDLEVRPGEVFGLLGPNGSGKTTTIKILLGLLYPTRGAARIFGRPPTDTAIKARIGFMPEESYLYRYLNANETLDYYGRLFKLDRVERRRRIGQLIDMVGLKRAADRPIGGYSKGMARRIGLAQALINDPDLLILDEPTTGLDPLGTRQIKDVIRALAARGKTVLMSSHVLDDVEDCCDRVIIMYGGRKQALGPVNELLQRREVTQITTRQLDAKSLGQVEAAIQRAGGQVLSVEHPTDKLEALFLRVVGQAQRDKLATSGAESGGAVSEFLTSPSTPTRSLVETLVDAGRAPESGASTTPVEPAAAPAPRTELLERLSAPRPATEAEPAARTPASPAKLKPDESVISRLLQDGGKDQ